jgi:hypothetical protein
MEFVGEEDGTGLLVGAEEVLDGDLELPRESVLALNGEVKNKIADEVVDPRLDAAIGPVPSRIVGALRRGVVDVRHENQRILVSLIPCRRVGMGKTPLTQSGGWIAYIANMAEYTWKVISAIIHNKHSCNYC